MGAQPSQLLPQVLLFQIPLRLQREEQELTSLADGHVLLGSGTGAVTALDVTAKGSILAGDGTTDPVALAVGTNDYVLTADSSEASGLKWAAVSSGGGGDITSVVAGDGLTGGATSGDATLTLAVGQTTITSISNAGLKVGRDQHNLIDFGTTDNRIFFRVSDTDQIVLIDGAILPSHN